VHIDQFWSLLRQRLPLAVALFLLVAGGVSAWSLTRTPVYAATADVYITIDPSGSKGTLYQDSQYALDKVRSYTNIAVTPTVLTPVADALGLDATAANALSDAVTAANPDGTSIIEITAQDPSPARAAAIANGVAAQLAPAIKTLEPTQSAASVKASVVRSATTPESPVFPRNTLNILLGVLAGLLVGVGTAVAVGRIDTSVRTASDMESLTGAAPLGRIGFDKGSKTKPTVALNPQSDITEDYRSVRARLAFASADKPVKRLLVTSALPGEGKSTVTVNLATVLAQSGAKVCLIEGDVRRPKLSQILGLENAVGLTDVLVGKYPLNQALVSWGGDLLTVLPAGTNPPDPGELFASQHMRDLMDELGDRFDYVIIDTPPLLAVADASVIGTVTDGAILVARHGKVSRSKLQQSLTALKASDTRLIGTVLNGVPRSGSEPRYSYQPVTPVSV
jgi:capsular exopolysaccharide synthesis family protein